MVKTWYVMKKWVHLLPTWQWYRPSLSASADGMVYLWPVARTVIAGPLPSTSRHQRYSGAGHPGGIAEQVSVTPVPSVATGLTGEIWARPGLCRTKSENEALPTRSTRRFVNDGSSIFTARHVYWPADSAVRRAICNTSPCCRNSGWPSRSHSIKSGTGFAVTLHLTVRLSPSSCEHNIKYNVHFKNWMMMV